MKTTYEKYLTEGNRDLYEKVVEAFMFNDNYSYNIRKLDKSSVSVNGNGVKFTITLKGSKIIIE